ncbi:ATP-dependent protease [Pelagibacteraceae bacterium GOM-A2]|nr:ATP-dependent protease [Pelagibacteraceae bacterium GOM-A2]
MNIQELPKTIPVFPLSNFIMFPGTTVPLNIFEPRYLQMVNDSMKKHRMIGMIQPKKTGMLKKPDLYEIGCVGKITSFNETEDGRILIILNGICRFKINSEIENSKLYRECYVQYSNFSNDISLKSNDVNFSDLNIIMDNMKKFFRKQGYEVNLKDLEKKDMSQTLNDLSMASPFSLEEKQILLESLDINIRKEKMEQILYNYIKDEFENTTLQ